MSGWKTWLGVLGCFGTGIYNIVTGDVQKGIELIIAGIGLIGIGSKIDKVIKK